jgi:hypothetical protein
VCKESLALIIYVAIGYSLFALSLSQPPIPSSWRRYDEIESKCIPKSPPVTRES